MANQEKYGWIKNSSKYLPEGEERWSLNLFHGNGKLPCLKKEGNIAEHVLMLRTFFPKPYRRPYRTEKQNEDDNTITLKKTYLGNYKGNVNTELELLYCDFLDAEGRGGTYFLDGDFKEGYGVCDGNTVIQTPNEFKLQLTEYFSKRLSISFGEHLGNLILNSNLPTKQRDAVRGILE